MTVKLSRPAFMPETFFAPESRLSAALERNRFRLESIGVLTFWRSMIFSENRFPLFRIML